MIQMIMQLPIRKYLCLCSLGLYYGLTYTSYLASTTVALLQVSNNYPSRFSSTATLQQSPTNQCPRRLACHSRKRNHCIRSDPQPVTLEIHRTIQSLQEKQHELPQPTTQFVVQVLERWSLDHGHAHEWKSLLNKNNLFSEIEESIVAIHELREWWTNSTTNADRRSLIVLDACCGKGVYSTLLSYLTPTDLFGTSESSSAPVCESIIALDKDPKINWNHVHAANSNHEEESRPMIQIWSPANLFHLDELVDKLADQLTKPHLQIAMNGIHLCKTLSPALIGLANSMGPERVPFLCLAPCCLPRLGQPLIISQYESPMQREARQLQMRMRQRQPKDNKKRRITTCFVCQGDHHVRNCPERQKYSDEQEWNELVSARLLARPKRCWKCGQEGHTQTECQNVARRRTSSGGGTLPPRQILHMSPDYLPTESDPSLQHYCKVLASAVQGGPSKQVKLVHADLSHHGTTTMIHNKESKGIDGSHHCNWNRHRKSLYLVVTR